MRHRVLLSLVLLSMAPVLARPVYVAGQPTLLETRLLQGQEVLPLEAVVLLGGQVNQTATQIELAFQSNKLTFHLTTGWARTGVPGLVLEQGKWFIPIKSLEQLGLKAVSDAPEVLDFVTAAVPAKPAADPQVLQVQVPTPPAPTADPTEPVLPQFQGIRHSVQQEEYTQRTRIVLDLNLPTQYEVKGNQITLLSAAGSKQSLTFPTSKGVKGIRVEPGTAGMQATITLSKGAEFTVFPLQNPPRVVIDVFQHVRPDVPPFPRIDNLPTGTTYRKLGDLELLVFSKSLFQPRLTTGLLQGVETFVKQTGAVAGINGGYFDMGTGFPVDMVVRDGRLLFGGLEKRSAVGFTATGDVMWGVPRARYTLSTPLGQVRVNSVRAAPRDGWLTLFVGDGKNQVGGKGFTTVTVQDGVVTRVSQSRFKPAEGEMTVTFQPDKYAFLPTAVGFQLNVGVAWEDENWLTARDVLAAGPMLVRGSQYVVNPIQEAFDTSKGVWRATRQVAFGTMENGDYVFAYLKWGTPEAFARALLKAGLKEALRLDSGTSATVFVSGGFLNRTWSRPVPNAILMMPKDVAQAKR